MATAVQSEPLRAFLEEMRQPTYVPYATYRLQMNRQFTFEDARRLASYLADLGIGTAYTSPYLRARPESMHGYDVVDHNSLNPAIGNRDTYRAFVAELKRHGLGQVLDVVPNHMGIRMSADDQANAWWMDVLESGQSSPYYNFFDIEWEPLKDELRGKVLLPILGGQYGEVLEHGELRLGYQAGRFFVHYYDKAFPISPAGAQNILRDALERLSENEPRLAELAGVTSALARLPSGYSVSDPEYSASFHEQKLAAQRDLNALAEGWPELRRAIEVTVEAFNGVVGEPRSFDRLDSLLNAQPYRLAYWRVASEEINYRRFFDINDLAAIRMEDPRVFEATHRLILGLLEEGSVDGLRLDHPDGLWDPAGYFRRLQGAFALQHWKQWAARQGLDADAAAYGEEALARLMDPDRLPEGTPCRPLYLLAEKILSKGESLREDWAIWGTTGYEFCNAVNGIFVDSSAEKLLDRTYAEVVGGRLRFEDVAYEGRRRIMRLSLASEVAVLANWLERLSERDRHYRDFTYSILRNAIVEVAACFPVYRTYNVVGQTLSDADRRVIETAVARAKRRNPGTDPSVFDYLRALLLSERTDSESDEDYDEQYRWVTKFQQLTGPVAAKGVEDTALYVYNRLVSLNEVGGDPDVFGMSVANFHRLNAERRNRWPNTLLASSTHDSKRGEDVRARIDVLSELPGEWRRIVHRWQRLNARKKPGVEGAPVPDGNEEYLIYQTLLGVWPLVEPTGRDVVSLIERVNAYLQKAMREAKVNTSWIAPNEAYEQGVALFVGAILDRTHRNPFFDDLVAFQRRLAEYGMLNSLAQTLLKATVPGVPDFYQGTELFEFTLVDPDNRRPVDYARRQALLAELRGRIDGGDLAVLARELFRTRRDGRIKLFVTHRALDHRRGRQGLFAVGAYVPLEAQGRRTEHVFAFARQLDEDAAVVVVPRLTARLKGGSGELPAAADWADTSVPLPEDLRGIYRNVFTGETLESGDAGLPLDGVLGSFPVALLERIGPSRSSNG